MIKEEEFFNIPLYIVIVLVLIVILRLEAPGPVRSRGVILLCLAGSVILGIDVVYYLFVWFFTMEYGEGVIEFLNAFLIPAIPLIVIICLAWVRPLECGVVLTVSGIVTWVVVRQITIFPAFGTPYVAAGILFLVGGLIGRRRKPTQPVEQ